MSRVRIGVTLPQFTDDPARLSDGVRRAERLGFDSVWVFDHLWPLGGKRERPIVESWTALAFLASITSGVEIGTLVTRSSLRHPVILAKMAATVAAIAPQRLIVGIGSGDELNKDENDAFGAPHYSGADRVEQLVATLQVVQHYLRRPRVDVHHRFADVDDLPPSPRSDEPARVWVGGRSAEVLEVAGRLADGWNGWGANLDTFVEDAARVRDVAGARPVEISWAGQVVLGRSDAAARDALGERDPAQYVVGGPETVASCLRRAVEAGAEHLVVALPAAGAAGAYEALAEVAAEVRGSA